MPFFMKYLSSIVLLLTLTSVCAQRQNKVVHIAVTLGEQNVLPEKKIAIPQTDDSVSISVLKFYLSNFSSSLSYKNNALFDKSSCLLDFHSIIKLNLHELPAAYDKLSFVLGVDSLTNTSGALSGDLDPLNGMYWTWQSGYINFKIEGIIFHKDNSQQEFTCHLGGYRFPYDATQKVSLVSLKERDDYGLNLDLTEFLQELMTKKNFHVMSPGKVAIELSALLAHGFRFEAP